MTPNMPIVFDIPAATLLAAGRIAPTRGWAMPAHAHEYWEFVYFVRGYGRIDVPGAVLHPQQFHLAIYPPRLPHAEAADPQDPEETVFFSAEVPGTPPLGAHLLLPDPAGDLRWLAEHLLAEYRAHRASPLATSYLHAFLHLVERGWSAGVPVAHDAVDVALQLIHARYADPLTLAELAEAAHVSPTHLVHRFTARQGCSPMRHLQAVRLDAARRLLATTDLPVQAVARQVGYADPLYFSRVFRREVGKSPTGFREATGEAEGPSNLLQG
jgi:AraC-like DNA-binding protein